LVVVDADRDPVLSKNSIDTQAECLFDRDLTSWIGDTLVALYVRFETGCSSGVQGQCLELLNVFEAFRDLPDEGENGDSHFVEKLCRNCPE
jgi:hypothetical protein